MRMISKITSEKLHLTKGKTYYFEKTPKMYDPVTFKEVIGYIIQNDLGKYIKVNEEGYATYSYEILWPGYNTIHDDFSELIIQFKRNQKIEDILE